MDRFSLAGKVILLTGGTGQYGRGLAEDIATSGANLIVASRDLEACRRLVSNLHSKGLKAIARRLDQGSEDSIGSVRDALVQEFGRIDGLVNNAVSRPMKSAEASSDAWDESMAVNAKGIFLMHRHFGGVMRDQEFGSIVNIGSIQGMVGPKLSLYDNLEMISLPPDYFFHKGGMINLTRYFAALYGPANVRVNCISPGGFFNHQPEAFVKRYSEQTFLGRMGNESDLGGAVIFFLSQASAYITGINLPVDGGYTAQ